MWRSFVISVFATITENQAKSPFGSPAKRFPTETNYQSTYDAIEGQIDSIFKAFFTEWAFLSVHINIFIVITEPHPL